jgi:pimeloyl-ACP methyl ester carboxylesterase
MYDGFHQLPHLDQQGFAQLFLFTISLFYTLLPRIHTGTLVAVTSGTRASRARSTPMRTHRNDNEYIEVNDNVFLHIRDWGEGHTIVFIPGLPFGQEMFEYQFTWLPQYGCRCIGISMRGFGKSSQPWGEYTYDIFADDLHTALHTLNLSNITLAGFGMGGAIALRYMSRHNGERIANLALCGAAVPSFTIRPGFPFGTEPGAMEKAIDLCNADRARFVADFSAHLFKDSATVTPKLLDWFHVLGMEASPHATAACLATLRDTDLREDLKSVHVPTIILHGVYDQICPFGLTETITAPTDAMPAVAKAMAAEAEAIAGGIQGAKLIRFESSGHALFYEEREKFNSELKNFIEKKGSGEGKYFGPATR